MINSSTMVIRPRIMARTAARSRDPGDWAKLTIMGLMVWNLLPPIIKGADSAQIPVRKVMIVSANSVGFSVGSTTLKRIRLSEAPMFLAASIVW